MSREAMKQALDALEERYVGALRDKAMDALRAALDAPDPEPVAWMHNFIEDVVVAHRPADLNRHPDRWTALYK